MATGDYRLTAVLAFLLVAGTTAAGWQGGHSPGNAAPRVAQSTLAEQAIVRTAAIGVPSPDPRATPHTPAARIPTHSPSPSAQSPSAHRPSPSAHSPSPSAHSPSPSAHSSSARSSCPATATACVDLERHITWLQSGGRITYGPVSMEPGPPGTDQATPRGTFHVEWKAGANYISTEYHVPIPYAVFFAPGGVAFHGGSLTTPSHGCVHLDIGGARYYHDHLQTGAEVVVF